MDMDQPLGRLVDFILKIVMMFILWGLLSINGTIPEAGQCKPAVAAWEYVAGGQMMEERFIKRAENMTFPVNSYEKYINTGSNANLAASDEAAANVSGHTLYIASKGELCVVKNRSIKKYRNLGDFNAPDAMVVGKRCVLGVDEGEITFTKVPKLYSYTLDEKPDALADENENFDEVADRLYALLKKQQSSEITAEEMAVLAYYAKKGTLLAFEDDSALLADDWTEDGMVYVYQQTAPGERKEFVAYEDDYDGLGAGRFIADGGLWYIENGRLNYDELYGDQWLYFPEEICGRAADALNYVHDEEGTLWVTYMDGTQVHMFDMVHNRHKQFEVAALQEGAELSGLFTMEDKVFVCFEGTDRLCRIYEMNKIK